MVQLANLEVGPLPALLHPIWRYAESQPDQVAVIDEDRQLTYASLQTEIERQAAQFAADGIGPGEAVLVLFDVCIESVIAYWALHACEAVIVVGDPTCSDADMAHFLKTTGACHILAGRRAQERLRRPTHTAWHVPDPHVWRRQPGTAETGRPRIHTESCNLILFSSGTTSAPKAIMHSREAIQALHETLLQTWGLSPDDRVLGALPFHTIYGLIFSAASTLHAGATLVLLRRFHPRDALQAIQTYQITTSACVPAMLLMMMAYEGAHLYDVSSLRMVYSASAPISEADIERYRAFSNATVLCNYGMTEIPGAAVEVAGKPHRARSAGKISPGFEVVIRDEEGQPCPPDVVGEVTLRGPTLMQGYLDAPERTAERVRKGWIYSQDRGLVDADGHIQILGRKSDMIIRGGLNISPLEVEAALSHHAAVKDVAVVGPQDPILGQTVAAFVVPRSTVAEPDLPSLLLQHCRTTLAAAKVPSTFHLIDSIPRNAGGKIDRKALLAKHPELTEGTADGR